MDGVIDAEMPFKPMFDGALSTERLFETLTTLACASGLAKKLGQPLAASTLWNAYEIVLTLWEASLPTYGTLEYREVTNVLATRVREQGK
jgi:hypothetical protein